MNRDFLNPVSLMDNFFNEIMGTMPQIPVKTIGGMFGAIQTDVKETDSNYELIMNVPGLKKEDIDITITDGILTVKSEIEAQNEQTKDDKYIIKERISSSFNRAFKLPNNINSKDISAKMEDGVLHLVIPKQDKIEESNKISIN